MKPSGEIPALTSLRFLAAALVLVFHYPPALPASVDFVAREGHIGVTIFFVLSGFLITRRYAARFAAGQIDLRDYFVKRAARILPLYYTLLVLSLMLTRVGPFAAWRLPEWTLTQGLFSESIHVLALPTSWSLTVEECFYALAPLVLLSVAAARRRRGAGGVAATLAAWVLALLAAGMLLPLLVPATVSGFLSNTREATIHTIFGRFFDFACGIVAALLAPPVEKLWASRAGPWIASAGCAAACGLLLLGQHRMNAWGGIESPHWVPMWWWNVVVAPASALLVLSLTCVTSPVALVLSLAPLPWLGRVSYALYLLQISPITMSAIFPLMPGTSGWPSLLLLFAALILVSAVLYEVVEEPARAAVLRRFHVDAPPSAATPTRWGWGGGALVAAALGLQLATVLHLMVDRRLGPVTEAEAVAASQPGDVVTAAVGELHQGNVARVVPMPRRWREGWGQHTFAPRELDVFADGAPVRFTRREPEDTGAATFFRGPRAERLSLRGVPDEARVTVVRPRPPQQLRLAAARVGGRPALLALVVLLPLAFFAALALITRRSPLAASRGAWIAAAALLLWHTLEVASWGWVALAAVVVEAALLVLWLRRRSIPVVAAAAVPLALRQASAVIVVLTLGAGCGGGGSTATGPDAAPSGEPLAEVTGIVFDDENRNGRIDEIETLRLPDVLVRVGDRSATTDAAGRFLVAGGSRGAAVTVDVPSLPPYYEPGQRVTAAPGLLPVPVVLPIGSNTPRVFLGFGDSITNGEGSRGNRGYVEPLGRLLTARWGATVTVVTDAVDGSRSQDGLARLPDALSRVRPAYTLIAYGTNDYRDCRKERNCTTIENLRAMVRLARAAQSLPVVATMLQGNVEVSDPLNDARDAYILETNDAIRELGRAEGVPVADAWAAFAADRNPSRLFTDYLHPNERGFELIAQEFYRAITTRR